MTPLSGNVLSAGLYCLGLKINAIGCSGERAMTQSASLSLLRCSLCSHYFARTKNVPDRDELHLNWPVNVTRVFSHYLLLVRLIKHQHLVNVHALVTTTHCQCQLYISGVGAIWVQMNTAEQHCVGVCSRCVCVRLTAQLEVVMQSVILIVIVSEF